MTSVEDVGPVVTDDFSELFSVLQSSPGMQRRRSNLPGVPQPTATLPPALAPVPMSQYNSKPSDIVFLVGQQRFPGHKETICRMSPYFARQLSQVLHLSPMDIEVEIRDCHPAIFGKILHWMYTQQADPTPTDVWELNAKAEAYELTPLAAKCLEYIMTFITPDNVWQMHASAVEMGADSIAERCLQYANMLKQQQVQQQRQLAQQPGAMTQQVQDGQAMALFPAAAQGYAPMSISQAGSPAPGAAKGPPSPMVAAPMQLASQAAPLQQQRMSASQQGSMPPPQSFSEQWTYERTSVSPFEAPTTIPAAAGTTGSGAAGHAPSPLMKPEHHSPGSPSAMSDAGTTRKEMRLDDPQNRAATLEWALEHLNVLSNMVKTLLDADRISLFLYNEDTNELCALLDNMCEIRIPVGNGIAGAVFTSGKMINSRDPYSDSRFLSDVDKQTGYRTSSILCMPIILSNGRVSGVIEVLNKRSRTKPGQRVFFTKQDETTLDHVCRLSGNLLERIPEYVHSIQIQEDGSMSRGSDPAARVKRTADARGAVGYKRNKRNSIPIFHFKLPGKAPQ